MLLQWINCILMKTRFFFLGYMFQNEAGKVYASSKFFLHLSQWNFVQYKFTFFREVINLRALFLLITALHAFSLEWRIKFQTSSRYKIVFTQRHRISLYFKILRNTQEEGSIWQNIKACIYIQCYSYIMERCNTAYFIAVLFVLVVNVVCNEEESASFHDYSSNGGNKGNLNG